MLFSLRSVRIAAVGAASAGALTSALLFGAVPMAQAAPTGPGTIVATAGPSLIPVRGGNGGWGHGPDHGFGHGGWGGGWDHRPWWRWW
ncbi:MAG: hypothetical protein QOD58_3517 [Mycobacterium sp.]|nr:hypothetical protein [Mycobacterium sp.]